jgi:hypothetical protein
MSHLSVNLPEYGILRWLSGTSDLIELRDVTTENLSQFEIQTRHSIHIATNIETYCPHIQKVMARLNISMRSED